MKSLDISEVVQSAGVPASTLRFYEEKGLIASIGRQGLRRQFNATVLEQLALISMGRAAGLPLDDIAAMFGADGQPSIDRKLLASRADQLERTVHRLTVMCDALRHAAACSAPSHMECPTFRRILRAAESGAFAGRRVKKGLR